jgi:hypothetical protein
VFQAKEWVTVTPHDQRRGFNTGKPWPKIVGSAPNIVLCLSDSLPLQHGIVLSMVIDKPISKRLIDFRPGLKVLFTLGNGLIRSVIANTLEY